MLGALLAHALCRAGFVVETSPGEPVVLVRGEARLEPFARLRVDIADKVVPEIGLLGRVAAVGAELDQLPRLLGHLRVLVRFLPLFPGGQRLIGPRPL